jgi:hypothetical protein
MTARGQVSPVRFGGARPDVHVTGARMRANLADLRPDPENYDRCPAGQIKLLREGRLQNVPGYLKTRVKDAARAYGDYQARLNARLDA